MIRLATQQRRRTKLDIEFLDLPGERIFLENGSVDTVVSTFALCMVPGVVEVIRGIGRVLRPGGQVHLFSSTGSHPILEYSAGSGGRSPFLTGVRRLPRNTGHSVSDRSGRVQDRGDGNDLPRPISETVLVLLVGHRGPAVTIAAVRPSPRPTGACPRSTLSSGYLSVARSGPRQSLMRCVLQAEQVIQRLLTVYWIIRQIILLRNRCPWRVSNRASSLEKQSLLRRFDCRGGHPCFPRVGPKGARLSCSRSQTVAWRPLHRS